MVCVMIVGRLLVVKFFSVVWVVLLGEVMW